MAFLRIDPHVHSEASYDAHDPIELILEQAQEIGLDAVVITDHNTMEESWRAAELAEDYGLIGIPGVEVSTAVGHVLAIGVDAAPESHQPLMQTITEIREAGGAAIIAHPFQLMRHGIRKKYIKDCDAVEGYNAWLFTGFRNRRAQTFARRRGYPIVAGSDAHSVATVGRAFTEIEFSDQTRPADITAEMIVDAIKDGKTGIRGNRLPIHQSAGHYIKGAAKITAHKSKQLLASVLS